MSSHSASLKDFVILGQIGEGSYSSVHQVKRHSDGHEYALKKVKMGNLKEKQQENALNEVRLLASIDHPNMISYQEAFFDEPTESLCIVMQYADQGDLQQKIDTAIKARQAIPEDEIWRIFINVLRGLKALHSRQILHRDIKCANIFISQDHMFKLGDLNVSKVAQRGMVYTQTGTPYYASPEVWRDQPYDTSSDVWSLGCIIFQCAALKPPFRAKDMEGLFKRVQKGIFQRIPTQYSNELQSMITACLKVNPSQRPTVKQLLNHPIIKEKISLLFKENKTFNGNHELNSISVDAGVGHNRGQTATIHQENELENTITQNPLDLLLQTIKLPKNLKLLKNKLPKANYSSSRASEKGPVKQLQDHFEDEFSIIPGAANGGGQKSNVTNSNNISVDYISANKYQAQQSYINQRISTIGQQKPKVYGSDRDASVTDLKSLAPIQEVPNYENQIKANSSSLPPISNNHYNAQDIRKIYGQRSSNNGGLLNQLAKPSYLVPNGGHHNLNSLSIDNIDNSVVLGGVQQHGVHSSRQQLALHQYPQSQQIVTKANKITPHSIEEERRNSSKNRQRGPESLLPHVNENSASILSNAAERDIYQERKLSSIQEIQSNQGIFHNPNAPNINYIFDTSQNSSHLIDSKNKRQLSNEIHQMNQNYQIQTPQIMVIDKNAQNSYVQAKIYNQNIQVQSQASGITSNKNHNSYEKNISQIGSAQQRFSNIIGARPEVQLNSGVGIDSYSIQNNPHKPSPIRPVWWG